MRLLLLFLCIHYSFGLVANISPARLLKEAPKGIFNFIFGCCNVDEPTLSEISALLDYPLFNMHIFWDPLEESIERQESFKLFIHQSEYHNTIFNPKKMMEHTRFVKWMIDNPDVQYEGSLVADLTRGLPSTVLHFNDNELSSKVIEYIKNHQMDKIETYQWLEKYLSNATKPQFYETFNSLVSSLSMTPNILSKFLKGATQDKVDNLTSSFLLTANQSNEMSLLRILTVAIVMTDFEVKLEKNSAHLNSARESFRANDKRMMAESFCNPVDIDAVIDRIYLQQESKALGEDYILIYKILNRINVQSGTLSSWSISIHLLRRWMRQSPSKECQNNVNSILNSIPLKLTNPLEIKEFLKDAIRTKMIPASGNTEILSRFSAVYCPYSMWDTDELKKEYILRGPFALLFIDQGFVDMTFQEVIQYIEKDRSLPVNITIDGVNIDEYFINLLSRMLRKFAWTEDPDGAINIEDANMNFSTLLLAIITWPYLIGNDQKLDFSPIFQTNIMNWDDFRRVLQENFSNERSTVHLNVLDFSLVSSIYSLEQLRKAIDLAY